MNNLTKEGKGATLSAKDALTILERHFGINIKERGCVEQEAEKAEIHAQIIDAFGCHRLGKEQIKKAISLGMQTFISHGDLISTAVAVEYIGFSEEELIHFMGKLKTGRMLRSNML